VWTTFNAWQWDLNWHEPDVLCEFAELICFLANAGVECLRLDAIAFLWKRLGTDCQNQPEVHALTAVLRAVARIAAPAMVFKAEAIVGPGAARRVPGTGPHSGKVSDLAYHNSLMVQIWSSLAAGDARLMTTALRRFVDKPSTTAWATYLRCHDDIGWAVDDADAGAVGWSGDGHRRFLSDWYSGAFPAARRRAWCSRRTWRRATAGSAAQQPLSSGWGRRWTRRTGQRSTWRCSGWCSRTAWSSASAACPCCGWVTSSALRNDPSWADEPAHADDNRWAHRPAMPWDVAERRHSRARSSSGLVALTSAVRGARRCRPCTPRADHAARPVNPAVVAGSATPRPDAARAAQHDGGAAGVAPRRRAAADPLLDALSGSSPGLVLPPVRLPLAGRPGLSSAPAPLVTARPAPRPRGDRQKVCRARGRQRCRSAASLLTITEPPQTPVRVSGRAARPHGGAGEGLTAVPAHAPREQGPRGVVQVEHSVQPYGQLADAGERLVEGGSATSVAPSPRPLVAVRISPPRSPFRPAAGRPDRR
jgi:hypothetical protein